MDKLKIYFMLIGFAIFTGVTFNLAKYTVAFLSPSMVAAWRFGIAAIIMLVVLFLTEGIQWSFIKQNALWYIIIGIVGVFGFNTFFFLGLKHTSAVNGSLIMAMNPLLTTILAWVILKDKISRSAAVGILFGFIGVLLVLTQGSTAVFTHLSFSTGDIIIFAGNLCWALYGILGRRFIKHGTPLSTTTYTMIVGAVALNISNMIHSDSIFVPDIPPSVWGAVVFMALFPSVLGYLWWNRGMKELGAAKTSLFFNFVPIVTMMTTVFTGTSITSVQIGGAVLVILGVMISSGVFNFSSMKAREV